MAKIIIKNGGLCVNPILTMVKRSYNGDTPLITFTIQNGTLNPPQPTDTNIMFQRYNGSTWLNLQGFNYTTYQYVWTIGSDGIGSNLNLGTLFRIRITHPQCGESFSNSEVLEL